MQFSSVPTLVDAYIQSELTSTPLKSASLFLYVAAKDPFTLEDTNKVRVAPSVDDQLAFATYFDRIAEASNICLDNIEVNVSFSKGYAVTQVQLSSRKVITEIGSAKEKELKGFELKVRLQSVDGQLPLALSTYNYLRRKERQDLVKKHYKPSQIDVLKFVPKNITVESSSNSELTSLDSESIQLLRKLLGFVDKEELFRVLLKKPLREKQSKKAVRLSIIPTDVSLSEGFSIKKKTFNRNTVLELLNEYEARQERINQ